MPIWRAGVWFERRRVRNWCVEARARLTVDQTVSAVPVLVAKVGWLVSCRMKNIEVIFSSIYVVVAEFCPLLVIKLPIHKIPMKSTLSLMVLI